MGVVGLDQPDVLIFSQVNFLSLKARSCGGFTDLTRRIHHSAPKWLDQSEHYPQRWRRASTRPIALRTFRPKRRRRQAAQHPCRMLRDAPAVTGSLSSCFLRSQAASLGHCRMACSTGSAFDQLGIVRTLRGSSNVTGVGILERSTTCSNDWCCYLTCVL